MTSALRAKAERRNLHRRSSLAGADALARGANLLPHGDARAIVKRMAKRQHRCATAAKVRLITGRDGATVLKCANSHACHSRACPWCMSEMANRAAHETFDIVQSAMSKVPRSKLIMITATLKNAPVGDEGPTIYEPSQKMFADVLNGTTGLMAEPRIKAAAMDWVASIESDFAVIDGQLTVHWHAHILALLQPGALSDQRYITQAEYVRTWKRVTGVTYQPILDVRVVRDRSGHADTPTAARSAAREAVKYACDTAGFFHHEDGHISVDPRAAVAFVVTTYKQRLRLMSLGFKRLRRQLRAESRRTPRTPDSETNSDT